MTPETFKGLYNLYGHEPVDITPQLVVKWWFIFDDIIFNNTINKFPAVVELWDVNEEDDAIAWVRDPYILGFNKDGIPDYKMFWAILAHEMAHVHTMKHYPTQVMHHSPKFKLWKDKVNECGMPFGITYCESDFNI